MRKTEWCDVITSEVSRRSVLTKFIQYKNCLTCLLCAITERKNKKLKPNKNSFWHAFIIMIKLPLRRWENYWNWKKIEIYLCWFGFNILRRRIRVFFCLCKKIESIMLMEFLITLFIYHCWISLFIFFSHLKFFLMLSATYDFIFSFFFCFEGNMGIILKVFGTV